jgi:hypothetical protein
MTLYQWLLKHLDDDDVNINQIDWDRNNIFPGLKDKDPSDPITRDSETLTVKYLMSLPKDVLCGWEVSDAEFCLGDNEANTGWAIYIERKE